MGSGTGQVRAHRWSLPQRTWIESVVKSEADVGKGDKKGPAVPPPQNLEQCKAQLRVPLSVLIEVWWIQM